MNNSLYKGMEGQSLDKLLTGLWMGNRVSMSRILHT